MPAVSSDIKDLMCYQLNKFQRTTQEEEDTKSQESIMLNQRSESADNILRYQNLLIPNSDTLECECDSKFRCSSSGNNSPKDKFLSQHHSFHFCPEFESQIKRCRRIIFGSGGDMTVDKSQAHGYANTSWLQNPSSDGGSPPPPLLEKSFPAGGSVVHRNNSLNNGHNNGHQTTSTVNNNNLTISLNLPLPATIDFDNFLKTHSLSISINVREKSQQSKSTLLNTRSAIDNFNRELLIKSGWYYRNVDWQESRRLLKSSPLGTFILRDSGDPRYSFSLSVQTTKGPISSRISFQDGKYRLDSQVMDVERMPAFPTIIALISHYIKNGLVQSACGRQVWIDSMGQVCSPVQLTKPKLKEPNSLKHMSRLVLNANPSLMSSPDIPSKIKSYLEEYPYTF